jgi:hypothetical protein
VDHWFSLPVLDDAREIAGGGRTLSGNVVTSSLCPVIPWQPVSIDMALAEAGARLVGRIIRDRVPANERRYPP